MFSESNEISFNDVPKAVAHLINKVDKIETLLTAKQPQTQEGDQWFNLDDLCKYHPDHPAKPTVYAWIGQRSIPYHKKGKKLTGTDALHHGKSEVIRKTLRMAECPPEKIFGKREGRLFRSLFARGSASLYFLPFLA